MRRTNTFEVVPQSERADTVLRRLLDASASLWNQLTYARRQQFFAGESVWDCEGYYDEYVDVLSAATTQPGHPGQRHCVAVVLRNSGTVRTGGESARILGESRGRTRTPDVPPEGRLLRAVGNSLTTGSADRLAAQRRVRLRPVRTATRPGAGRATVGRGTGVPPSFLRRRHRYVPGSSTSVGA
jgi:hypothetical protein